MARDNYSFQKRAKELAKKKKQEEKRQRKLDKKNNPQEGDAQGGETPEGEVVPGSGGEQNPDN